MWCVVNKLRYYCVSMKWIFILVSLYYNRLDLKGHSIPNIPCYIILFQGEDHPCFPDRGAEDRDEGPEGQGQEGINKLVASSWNISFAYTKLCPLFMTLSSKHTNLYVSGICLKYNQDDGAFGQFVLRIEAVNKQVNTG